jgi:3-hydroxyacyl-CoA dehydrogenase
LLEKKMNEHTRQKIGVVGGGLMGHGIAYLFAAAGHHVNVFEPFSDIRNSLPQRLLAIVELLGDDPRLLTRRDRKVSRVVDHPRQQQFSNSLHRDRSASEKSRTNDWHAFLESAAFGAAG